MADLSKLSDSELVVRTLEDSSYLGELIDRYETKLMRYIGRLTHGSDEVVQELLQEVFIKAYRNLHGFDTKLSFSSWIYRIAHNESVDFLRKNKHASVSLDSTDDDIGSLLQVLGSQEDVEAHLVQSESHEMIAKILADIPEKYRDVLVLHFLEEKSYTEMSDILKKPMGTIATLVNRAKKAFQNQASEYHLIS